jgi:hypothetical protein
MSAEPTIQCAFRLEESLVKRLDNYAQEMGKAQPGVRFTRADAVRALLVTALDQVERPRSRPKRQRPRR